MASRNNNKDDRLRQRIAVEAARIIVEESVEDFYAAKRKAVERLNLDGQRNLPRNDEIERAVEEYQRIFKPQTQPKRLNGLRMAALRVMEFLARYNPRLVGSVLRGTAQEHSAVTLHVFADTSEEIGLLLMDAHISYELGERRIRMGDGRILHCPVYRYTEGDEEIAVVVFPRDGIREAPLSEVDGKPMARASIAELRQLIK